MHFSLLLFGLPPIFASSRMALTATLLAASGGNRFTGLSGCAKTSVRYSTVRRFMPEFAPIRFRTCAALNLPFLEFAPRPTHFLGRVAYAFQSGRLAAPSPADSFFSPAPTFFALRYRRRFEPQASQSFATSIDFSISFLSVSPHLLTLVDPVS